MLELRVSIARVVDEAQPVFVECTFEDADGRTWRVIEKLPVVDASRSTSMDVKRSGSSRSARCRCGHASRRRGVRASPFVTTVGSCVCGRPSAIWRAGIFVLVR